MASSSVYTIIFSNDYAIWSISRIYAFRIFGISTRFRQFYISHTQNTCFIVCFFLLSNLKRRMYFTKSSDNFRWKIFSGFVIKFMSAYLAFLQATFCYFEMNSYEWVKCFNKKNSIRIVIRQITSHQVYEIWRLN